MDIDPHIDPVLKRITSGSQVHCGKTHEKDNKNSIYYSNVLQGVVTWSCKRSAAVTPVLCAAWPIVVNFASPSLHSLAIAAPRRRHHAVRHARTGHSRPSRAALAPLHALMRLELTDTDVPPLSKLFDVLARTPASSCPAPARRPCVSAPHVDLARGYENARTGVCQEPDRRNAETAEK
ncbi:hypothetical protein GGX14DRAFT_384510 [Mycena pura]|uniref:Uncharacterized protein n=1 Tax=Mycena pura TaxID=153505 RepID=A0AAD7E5X4_9AGAR|nr:hypothetical protein GGX14DRAFT_384510 [Mycena pura]